MRVAKTILHILETYQTPASRRLFMQSKQLHRLCAESCIAVMEKEGLLERRVQTNVYGDTVGDVLIATTRLGRTVLHTMQKPRPTGSQKAELAGMLE